MKMQLRQAHRPADPISWHYCPFWNCWLKAMVHPQIVSVLSESVPKPLTPSQGSLGISHRLWVSREHPTDPRQAQAEPGQAQAEFRVLQAASLNVLLFFLVRKHTPAFYRQIPGRSQQRTGKDFITEVIKSIGYRRVWLWVSSRGEPASLGSSRVLCPGNPTPLPGLSFPCNFHSPNQKSSPIKELYNKQV